MTEFDADARAFIARVRRRAGPTAADRARLRERLEPVWAAQRAQAMARESEVSLVPRARGAWSAWAKGLLLLSLGVLTAWLASLSQFAQSASSERVQRNTERVAARGEVTQPAAAPHPAAESHPAAMPHPADVTTARAVVRPEPSLQSFHRPTATRERAVQSRSRPPRRAARIEHAPAATSRDDVSSSARPGNAVEPLAAEARTQADAAQPSPTAMAEVAQATSSSVELHASDGGDVAPTLRSGRFTPQPIDAELRWLSAAQQALQRGQPSMALRLAQEHAFRFPRGALAGERRVVHALSLCALGRKTAARQVMSDLAASAPGSPLLARVRHECGF